MPRRQRLSASIGGYTPDLHDAQRQMDEIVLGLNGPRVKRRLREMDPFRVIRLPHSPSEEMLRSLVSRWIASGPNLRALLDADPNLRRLTAFGHTRLYPGVNGRGYLEWIPSPPRKRLEPWQINALQLFMTLITNPLWEQLQGPCRKCGDYFVGKSARKRVYCSRQCSSRRTAVSAVTKRRIKARQEKIRIAKQLITAWQKTPRTTSWKEWVANRTWGSDDRITAHWLTRAVKQGLIEAPRTTSNTF